MQTAAPTSADLLVVDAVLGLQARAGRHDPYPWQVHVATDTLGRDDAGRWTQPETSLIVSRQNGKSDLVAAVILTFIRYLGERVLYTTHSIQAATDLWRRVNDWVDNDVGLRRNVRHRLSSNGRERLEFLSGGVLQIATSKGKPPRGFDGVGLLVFDEIRELTSYAPVEAMGPTQTSARNPLLWNLSNAGHLRSIVLNGLRDEGRRNALAGVPVRRAWIEYSAPEAAAMDDIAGLLQANPAAGHGPVTLEYLLAQRPPKMTEAGYRTEHLCQWMNAMESVVQPHEWSRLQLLTAPTRPPAGCALAFDVDIDRTFAAVTAAWADPDTGRLVVAVVEHRPGAGWLVDAVLAWRTQLDAAVIGWDTTGPAGDLADDIRRHGVDLLDLNTADVTAAAAGLLHRIREETLTVQPAAPLDKAVAIAGQRPMGDRWTWRRRTTAGSICPLTGITLAAWAYDHRPVAMPAPRAVA